MILETFPVGPLQCNCTLLSDEEAAEAIVIDPGDEVSRIYRRIADLGLKLKQILVTHAHIDHVGGALKLKRLTGAPILLNENDLPLLKMMEAQAAWIGVPTPEVSAPDASLEDGMQVIAGDTLFAGSIGRTDLPGGNSRQIIDSIGSRLMVLPDETQVLPGHGPATSIGAERNNNPFLNLR